MVWINRVGVAIRCRQKHENEVICRKTTNGIGMDDTGRGGVYRIYGVGKNTNEITCREKKNTTNNNGVYDMGGWVDGWVGLENTAKP
jgi:hypothetical protein